MLPPLLVYSHLRWDFVFQRPQHLLSRLAQRMPLIVIEEPMGGPTNRWECRQPLPNLNVCRPILEHPAHGFNAAALPAMVKDLLEEHGWDDHVAWLYTPSAIRLAKSAGPTMLVYDCMDQLSAFLNAPQRLVQDESDLLAEAAVVFTGGPSLYRDKKDRNPNVHCFASSVDAKHFGQARAAGGDADEQRDLPRPRIGFFGVLDERLDLEVLDTLATARPQWQIIMVGPVVKIDPSLLPGHPNIQYFGQQPYEKLPSYLAGWDVAILPFAMNEATKFISPTKTLEYMAAEKMIVSAPITDVAEPYGEIVYLADSPKAFVEQCERALMIGETERAERVAKMRGVLAQTSWDRTAESMFDLMREAYGHRAGGGNSAAGASDATQAKAVSGSSNGRNGQSQRGNGRLSGGGGDAVKPARIAAAASERAGKTQGRVVVIGAGPTGLSATYHLGGNTLLVERNATVGGWCRSIELKGFTFDYAGHIMFSKDPYVHELYGVLLGDNVHWQDREAWIYSKKVYTRYPFQGALYGLPPEVISECVVGAVEARFGPMNEAAPPTSGKNEGNGKACDTADGKGDTVEDCCADGLMESTARLAQLASQKSTKPTYANFEEFIYKVWGAGIAKHFAIPYNRKLWAVPLTEMETSWLGGRVPMPDLREMIEGGLKPTPKPMGPNARFGYPRRGGFQALMNGFLPYIKHNLRLNTGVVRVSPSKRTVTLSDGSELAYECLISTMPLPMLIRALGEEAPAAVRQAAAGLRNVSVRCVHLGIGREKLTEKHWIYYPEDTVFHRIFVQGNASPHCNPPGGFGLTCEITYSPHKPLPCDGEDLIQRCIADCHKVGIFNPEDPVIAATQVDLPFAYVVYDHARPKNVRLIREWLEGQDILLAGRYSEWEYYNSDHAFIAGKQAAEQVAERRKNRSRTEAETLPV